MSKREVMRQCGIFVAMLLIVMNLLTIIFSYAGIREQLGWMPFALLTVESGSMEPDYEAGDLLLVVETPYEELGVGDDICFNVNDELITHRIIRIEGDSITTQGISNEIEDTSITESNYCARVATCIPMMGSVLYLLQSTWVLLALTIALFLLCYGEFVVQWIINKWKKRKTEITEKWKTKFKKRSLQFLCAFTIIAVTPYYTAAKYVVELYGSTVLSAGSVYFTSNYLSQNTNKYVLNSWNGETYTMEIEICNYQNDLLVSDTDKPLYYGFEIIPIYDETDGDDAAAVYGTDYTVTVTTTETKMDGDYGVDLSDSSDEVITSLGTYTLVGTAEDGEEDVTAYKVTHKFTVKINPIEDELELGDIIRFQIVAKTSETEHFYTELSAEFKMVRSEETDFITSTQFISSASSNIVSFAIKTGGIDDGSAKKDVKITWDPDELYINEFENTAYQVIKADTDETSFSLTGGWIIIPLSEYSSIELQFFKRVSGSTISSDKIEVYVEDELIVTE